MNIEDQTIQPVGSTSVYARFREHLPECYTVALRILSNETLAEAAVINAVKEAESATDHISDNWSPLEDVVIRTARTCLRNVKESSASIAPRNPNRQETDDYSMLLICGMSALPIEGRVIVELHDRQQISLDEIAKVVRLDIERVRGMLQSCRLFLLEYFHLSKRNGLNAMGDC